MYRDMKHTFQMIALFFVVVMCSCTSKYDKNKALMEKELTSYITHGIDSIANINNTNSFDYKASVSVEKYDTVKHDIMDSLKVKNLTIENTIILEKMNQEVKRASLLSDKIILEKRLDLPTSSEEYEMNELKNNFESLSKIFKTNESTIDNIRKCKDTSLIYRTYFTIELNGTENGKDFSKKSNMYGFFSTDFKLLYRSER